MRICVTGNEGYLGSLLAPELLRRGHDVVGLDTGFYKEGTLYRSGDGTPRTLAKDLRQIEPGDFHGIEAVVHMAELSNDPLGQLAPNITYDINHKGINSARGTSPAAPGLKDLCICPPAVSMEWLKATTWMKTSPVNPQTAYAIM